MEDRDDQGKAPAAGHEAGRAAAERAASERLVAGLRQGRDDALRRFYLLYHPLLLDYARRMRVPHGNRESLVTTVLDNVALYLVTGGNPPRELSRYVVASLSNFIRRQHRDDERRHLMHAGAAGAGPFVAEPPSSYILQAEDVAEEGDDPDASRPLRELTRLIADSLTPAERDLLAGVMHHLPMREIATELGISHDAARVRLHRLRTRLGRAVQAHVIAASPAAQRELRRFFRRAGVLLADPAGDESPFMNSHRDRTP